MSNFSKIVLALILIAMPLKAKARDPIVVHFVLDGLNQAMFEKIMASNKAPFLSELIAKKGAYYKNSLSDFPSTSSSLYPSLSGGMSPGFCGVPHLERWDRNNEELIGYLTVKNRGHESIDFYNLKALLELGREDVPTTIFELLGDKPSASIFSSFRRGAKYAYPNSVPVLGLWAAATAQDERLDDLAIKKLKGLFKQPYDKIPRYSLVGLYSTDSFGHHFGPDSSEVEASVVRFDHYLKEFWQDLQNLGIQDDVMIIVSADHGMHASGKLFNLRRELMRAGIRIAKNSHKKGDVFVGDRGISSTHIYAARKGARPNESYWRNFVRSDGSKIDILQFLVGLEPTDFIALRDGHDKVLIIGKGGSARISCTEIFGKAWCTYVPQGIDPIGYSDDKATAPLVNSLPHSEDEWLCASAHSKYPDAVFGLWQIFVDGRAGDIFVLTNPLWGFRKIKKGTHGGMMADDMRIPLAIISNGGVKGDTIIRAIDIYDLAASHLNLAMPPHSGVHPESRVCRDDDRVRLVAAAELQNSKYKRISGDIVSKEIKRREDIIGRLKARALEVKGKDGDMKDIIAYQIERYEASLARLKGLK